MDAIEKLKDVFNKKRTDAEYTATLNKYKVFENPEFKKLYNECKQLSLDVAKEEYLHKDATVSRNAFKKLKAELYSKLEKAGINIKSLYPQYECNKCHDTGLTKNGYCDCFKKELSKLLLSESGLSDKNLPDFDNIKTDIITNKQQKSEYTNVSALLKEYINIIPNNTKHVITLIGEVGVGKTYLLKACVNEAIKKELYCYYTTAFALNQDMLKYHLSDLEGKDAVIRKYLDCDLLCIDDLGTENTIKNVTVEYLYFIINERLQSNKNTIITTNLTPQQIMQNYDERIFSRIANKKDCILINMTGDDLRLKSGK